MDSISRYLSTIPWPDQDESCIREYSTSPDFSRDYAENLVTRLGLDVVGEEQQQKMSDVICQSIVNALECWAPLNYRKFIEELLDGIQVGTSFAEAVIEVIIDMAKERLFELENNCQAVDRFTQVAYFAKYVSGICWILRLLLSAGVAEGLVQCLLRLNRIPEFLLSAEGSGDEGYGGWEMAVVVLQMYEEVVAERLLLRTAERVRLIETWHDLAREDYSVDAKVLFSTLPLRDQIELVEAFEESYIKFIDPRSLATLIKNNWSAMEGNSLPVVEG